MQSAISGTSCTTVQTVHVAIGIIHFAHHYLLGFRHAKQHQGNRYEFIGGKIEGHETPRQALVREVAEEIGLVVHQDNGLNRLGVLQHNYIDERKATMQQSTIVCLHVYRVTLTEGQYKNLLTLKHGCEQQPLKWVTQQHLLENRYKLPEANATILEWLKLADIITVTYELNHPIITTWLANTRITEPRLTQTSRIKTANAKQDSHLDNTQNRPKNHIKDNRQNEINEYDVCPNIEDWLEFQQAYLPQNSCVYVRLKTVALKDEVQAILQLIQHRPDLSLIISARASVALSQRLSQGRSQGLSQESSQPSAESLISNASPCHSNKSIKPHKPLPKQIIAQHLTQENLDKIDVQDDPALLPPTWHPTLPLTLSCHDENSIQKANKLAQARLDSNQPPVIALFLSPVMPTKSHPAAIPIGWRSFHQLARHSQVPVIALGGLTPDSLITARQHSADKIAGIHQFYQ